MAITAVINPTASATVSQTAGTATVLAFTESIVDGEQINLQFYIIGNEPNSHSVGSAIYARAVKNIGGVVSWVGVPLEVQSFINGSDDICKGAVISWGTGANSYQVFITGVAGVTINWVVNRFKTTIKLF